MLRAILGYTVTNAEVAELADAPALGAGGRKAVGVRVPSSARPILEIASVYAENQHFYWRFCISGRSREAIFYPSRSHRTNAG